MSGKIKPESVHWLPARLLILLCLIIHSPFSRVQAEGRSGRALEARGSEAKAGMLGNHVQ